MPSKRKPSDYSRVEDYISSQQEAIETIYGEPYDDMANDDKEQVLLDLFFKGNKYYTSSAQQMRQALDEYEGHPLSGDSYNVGHITKAGHRYTILRNANGRIRKWIKE